MKRVPITLRGAEALRVELRKLKSEDRPNVIKAIAEARAHGDLSENAEYHAAREQQGFIEGRIQETGRQARQRRDHRRHADSEPGQGDLRCHRRPRDEDNGAKVTYQIVGEDEADIKISRISFGSPIARALVGKAEGDAVEVVTPGGKRNYEIIAVRYV